MLVDVPNEKRPLLLVGSLDDETNVYPDVLKEKSYRFDHLNNSVTEEVSYEEAPTYSSQVLQMKRALTDECRKYVERRFSNRSSALFCFFALLTASVGCDGDHFDILIVGELIKLSSYYSGRWVSQYSVDMMDSTIHVADERWCWGFVDYRSRVHRFPLLWKRKCPYECATWDASHPARSVRRRCNQAIWKDRRVRGRNPGGAERDFHVAQAGCAKGRDGNRVRMQTFRRQLPRTRQHFQWNVNAHKMADTMKGMNK